MNDPRFNAASREEANKECGEEEREMDRFVMML